MTAPHARRKSPSCGSPTLGVGPLPSDVAPLEENSITLPRVVRPACWGASSGESRPKKRSQAACNTSRLCSRLAAIWFLSTRQRSCSTWGARRAHFLFCAPVPHSSAAASFAFQMSWVVFQVPSACRSRMLRYFEVDVIGSPPPFGVSVTSAMPRPYARSPSTRTCS